jgi:hypothetical protein
MIMRDHQACDKNIGMGGTYEDDGLLATIVGLEADMLACTNLRA